MHWYVALAELLGFDDTARFWCQLASASDALSDGLPASQCVVRCGNAAGSSYVRYASASYFLEGHPLQRSQLRNPGASFATSAVVSRSHLGQFGRIHKRP